MNAETLFSSIGVERSLQILAEMKLSTDIESHDDYLSSIEKAREEYSKVQEDLRLAKENLSIGLIKTSMEEDMKNFNILHEKYYTLRNYIAALKKENPIKKNAA